jgi:lipopolysaccharide export system permease protein
VYSSVLLDLLGPSAAVLAVLTTLALLMKHGELHPVLAAGVPTYRLAVPFVAGIVVVNVLLIANQELVIPRIAAELQGSHGEGADAAQAVDAQYDPLTWIYVSGDALRLADRTILRPQFLLNATLSEDTRKLTGESARFYSARGRQPAGWLVRNPEPNYDALRLTDEGRQTVLKQQRTGDVFVVSSLSADQLYNRGGSYRYLTTPELIRRIRLPGSFSSARAHIMHLHARLTRPIITLIGLFLVLPLIARRERTSLVQNVAVCMAALGIVYGLCLGGQMLGQSSILKPELAAWGPLMFGGGLCAWLSGVIRT